MNITDLALPLLLERPWLSTLLLLLGSFSVAQLALKTASVLMQTFILPGASLTRFGAKKGSWAVVTGASDGIGLEFALQLAKAGFNIVLVARNNEKLFTVAAQIDAQYGSNVSTKICLIDLSKESAAAYDALAKECEDLDIGILVNNAGRSHSMPVDFVHTPKQEIEDILAINIDATVSITRIILPGMIKRKRGLILNIGSFAGAVPMPMLATYSASKAFLSTFTDALGEEVKVHNIIAVHVNTYFVVSKLSKIRKPSMFIPAASDYVRSVLSKVGLSCGAAFTGRPHTSTPYWSHALIDYLMGLILPKNVFIRNGHNMQKSIRIRALKKQAKQ
jgi:17beta-estradiol 17-dehydrogenase / very-long-chain 3-oxoacyl-CoA reductase